jgi:hypothetical protein
MAFFTEIWVGKIPCRGPEAPQSALEIVLNIAARFVNAGKY